MALLPLQQTDNKDLSILQTKWKAILDVILSNPLVSGIQAFYTAASTTNGTPGSFTFENPDGSLADIEFNALTKTYWSGFHDSGYTWSSVSTVAFVDPTNNTVGTFTEKKNSNFGVVSTAAGLLPGITFTPASSSAVYFVSASVGGYNDTTGQNVAFELVYGTNQVGTGGMQQNGSVITTSPLNGLCAPESVSPVTLSIKMKVSANTGNIAIANANAIEWSIMRIA